MTHTLPPLPKLDPAEAWRPWTPDSQNPWNLKWAAHLYRRAAFGFPAYKSGSTAWEALQAAVKQGLNASLDQLFKGEPGLAEFDSMMDALGPKIGKSPRFDFQPDTGLGEVQGWWVYRMIFSPHPLQEKMTLFFHNHFATSVAKVKKSTLMLQQNQLIRRHALSKFPPLLLEMSKDPAMMIWLDSNSNVKAAPNENYAREVMELFSLGVGNYTEKDIREAARAFTGWHVAGDKFLFNPAQHDTGEKTILTKKGNWDGGDVVKILLDEPAAGRFLAKKLYRYFISENEAPPPELLEPLAEQLRKTGYDMGEAVKTVLRSRLFFSQHAYRQKIKSPAEYVVGLARSLNVQIGPGNLANSIAGLGQKLFAPPNVKGWDGGKAWLNSGTVLARHNLAWDLINAGGPPRDPESAEGNELVQGQPLLKPHRSDLPSMAMKHGGKELPQQLGWLLDLALQGDVPEATRQKLLAFLKEPPPPRPPPPPGMPPAKPGAPPPPPPGAQAPNAAAQTSPPDEHQPLRETLHTIMLLPEYQLA
jgi:uncharacterized protein (DUF1800 family)